MDLQFGGYRLVHRDRQVLGPEGPLDLSARSFDILNTLLKKPNVIISKNDLFDAVWPGVAVEENTLQVHVSALRKTLDPSMIVTVHGRGYRYAGPLPETLNADTPNAGAGSKAKPVIAVLPFENLSGDTGQQYFSDGITADITDRLARFRAFSVIGQYSASAFRDVAPDFAVLRDRLKVDFVVTGSLRRAGDRIRTAVRLSNAASEEAIWGERYDRPISDLFSLQDEISELVASAIARYLEIDINVRSAGRSHSSLSSHEHMLQGCWHFKTLTRAGSLAARQFFERAVALDSRSAEAISWLGCTYCGNWVQDFSEANAIKGAELTGQAIAIDPANAKCHATHAWALLCNNDLKGAVAAGTRGMMLNSGDPEVLVKRALILGYECIYAEAHELFDQARRLEPLPPLWFREFEGVTAFAEGDYEACLAGVESIVECAWDVMYALACCGHLGLRDKAIAVRRRFAAAGTNVDFQFGASRQPFRDPDVRQRLMLGLEKALSF